MQNNILSCNPFHEAAGLGAQGAPPGQMTVIVENNVIMWPATGPGSEHRALFGTHEVNQQEAHDAPEDRPGNQILEGNGCGFKRGMGNSLRHDKTPWDKASRSSEYALKEQV